MNTIYYVILFKINGDGYLLFAESFTEAGFRFTPVCFRNLEEANSLFDDFRETITRGERKDPEVMKQAMHLMAIYPVVCALDEPIDAYADYLEDGLTSVLCEFDLLNIPHMLVHVKTSFDRFALLDIAMDICNGMTVAADGHITIHQATRILDFK